ncbi:3-hydroxyacyl-ACP dehydratase [Dyadobacter luticola]|uniref:3-hydroxyacyl-ACP dehydratase n=1 Tax=Dyadobacter luticola TaxID=1979387 RepID=A0A5R9L4Q2_9BACT|nr:3-hydroxyacyl-ACP dehydratase [Dyadobacter luticola]TLV03552.1 3-hydroxyacyl-ACP dehydratase [Dyadobacter luticola]
MLENDLYNIQNIAPTAEGVISEILINASHRIFQGHFPGSPVTPGVVQIGFVKAVLQRQLNRNVTLKQIRTCKFLEVLDPNKTPVINIQLKYKESESLDVVASGDFGGVTFFKMQATYL